ncbi:mpv17-like protein [Mytilus trossulus]|uniref:mpv17-like protein n=1 Tax=Mytilus trossulus TaxID=6551 RepID=UPI003007289D
MPLHRTMMVYATLWTAADIVEQKYISKKEQHNVQKTVRIATVGTFVIAPLVFNWIKLAERLFPGKSVRTVLTKVLIEQFTFAPVSITSFYAATSLLERKNFIEELKDKFPVTWKTGITFWPFLQVINFGLVPLNYRPFVVAGGSFVWSIFLCFMKEDKKNGGAIELEIVPPITQKKETKNTS